MRAPLLQSFCDDLSHGRTGRPAHFQDAGNHQTNDDEGADEHIDRVPLFQRDDLRLGQTRVLLNKDHPALLRARRRHLAWTERERILYASHRARVEGVHGEEKAWHGLARAVRRGLANMKIQAYLTAAKRLAAAVAALLLMLLPIHRQSRSCTAA
jgi:hypothetical protein